MYKRHVLSGIPRLMQVGGQSGIVTLHGSDVSIVGTSDYPKFPIYTDRILGKKEDKRAFESLDALYRKNLQAPNGYSVLSWDGAHFEVLAQGLQPIYTAQWFNVDDPSIPDDQSPYQFYLEKITRYADSGRGAYIAPDYSVVPTGRDMTVEACPGCPRCGQRLAD